jgi:hypothetical protein
MESIKDLMRIKEKVTKYLSIRRKYASFYDWFNRKKNIKEIGITRIFMLEMEKRRESIFHNLSESNQDPPDVLAESFTGNLIGIEVCELVDEETIRKFQKGNKVVKNWSKKEVIEKIQNIINCKESKVFFGGPYEKKILLIHTDEPFLDFEIFEGAISKQHFETTNYFNEIFLFFSYSPKLGCCPYIKIKFS